MTRLATAGAVRWEQLWLCWPYHARRTGCAPGRAGARLPHQPFPARI